MSNADYRPGSFAGGRTTAGWFVLGAPFLLGFGLLMSLPFSCIARRTRPVVGWLCLLAVFVPLTALAILETTPVARLHTALGVEPPVGTRIHRIAQYDSFNDGSMTAGICSGNSDFVQTLIADHGLERSRSYGLLKRMLQDEIIPNEPDVLDGNGLTIWYDADRSLLYFCRHLGQRDQP